MRTPTNLVEMRARLSPGPARHPGLGPRPRYLAFCTYSPYRPEVCRLWSRTWLGAWWLAWRFTRAHPFALCLIAESAPRERLNPS